MSDNKNKQKKNQNTQLQEKENTNAPKRPKDDPSMAEEIGVKEK